MKRSEMIDRIHTWFLTQPVPDDDGNIHETISRLLAGFEKAGMLPPALPGVGTGKIKNRCRWEKEYETK